MARQWVSDAGTYAALFSASGAATALGDVSPVYLQSLNAPARLRPLFAEDIHRLQALIGRDLSRWLPSHVRE